ncbi:MAG TPA: hypothetical protein VGP33_17210 [Chloroflexota bacterium]|jgi:hypothetical protein|nr:hypothetical protein [Chloroflexota bacterium]
MQASDIAVLIGALNPLIIAVFGIWLRSHMQNKDDADKIIGATERAAGQIATGLARAGTDETDAAAYDHLLTQAVNYVGNTVPDAIRRKQAAGHISKMIEGQFGKMLKSGAAAAPEAAQ